MLKTNNIRSLTDFRQNAKDHLDRLADSGGFEVLTVNGEAKGVVMAPETFDDLTEKAMQAEITTKIKRGVAQIKAGQGVDAREAMREIADEFGLTLPQ